MEENMDEMNEQMEQGMEESENVQPAQEQPSGKEAQVADFQEFDESNQRGTSASADRLSLLKDLQLNVFIELGRTKMQIKDILELERGYVIELDKLASEPVDIFVNNKKIAEGEVVVIDKHFGIRIINLCDAADRLKGIY